ncbi:hypothetical protein D9756_009667 [Leucocoprinus leucothites]|uniref:Uncharacterized protein n=1 Tax=Leucocoprinus leucothites TaxID=201217 RepID=A0A8H5CV17_9AGAR|nr:hypothetical protein D9756_009667 [Leucoagaricus leucothites]
MGSLPSRSRLPEPSSNTAPSRTSCSKRSSNTSGAHPLKHSFNTSQSQSRTLNRLSHATPSQPYHSEQPSDTSAPESRPPEHSSGEPPSRPCPPGCSSNTPAPQAPPPKNSSNTEFQPSNKKTANYSFDSIARRHAQLDEDEETLRMDVARSEFNDRNIMFWIRIIRQDEDALTQRSITDCVCHHEPSCPNSRIFEPLQGYSQFKTSPISAFFETPNHARAVERFKRRQGSENGTDQPPGYQESKPRPNNPPRMSTASSSGFNLETNQFNQGCNDGNKAVTSMTAENELEEAYNAVERRAIRFEKSRKEMDQVHTEYDIFDRESEPWNVLVAVKAVIRLGYR